MVPLNGTIYSVSVTVYEPARVHRTLVCLHGVAGNRHDFDLLADFLARHGIRVVCPDMIGRGRSANAPDPGPYSVENHERILAKVIEEYGGKRVTLLGNGADQSRWLCFRPPKSSLLGWSCAMCRCTGDLMRMKPLPERSRHSTRSSQIARAQSPTCWPTPNSPARLPISSAHSPSIGYVNPVTDIA